MKQLTKRGFWILVEIQQGGQTKERWRYIGGGDSFE